MIVEDANKIGLSNGTFSALQLDQFAVFFTRIDRIGPKYSTKKSLTRREAKQETNNDYFLNDESVINVFDDDQSYQYDSVSGSVSYDYQYEEASDEPPSTYNQWLCVPESTFKNVRLAENALVQIHFIQVNFSLSITKNAFTEIQIDENAKFEMMFQDVKGHIVFDRGAVSMVTLTSGLFEIWIDNHRQKTAAVTTNRVNNPSPKFNPKYKLSSLQQKSFRVFNAANKIYFKMFDFAINKIALNSGSNFRIGFINSDSVFSLSSKSIRNYHLGRYISFKTFANYSF